MEARVFVRGRWIRILDGCPADCDSREFEEEVKRLGRKEARLAGKPTGADRPSEADVAAALAHGVVKTRALRPGWTSTSLAALNRRIEAEAQAERERTEIRFHAGAPDREAYERYIASAEWAAKRTLILHERGSVCENCGVAWRLQVHHVTYVRLGKELPEDLAVLCGDCHLREHGKSPNFSSPSSGLNWAYRRDVETAPQRIIEIAV